MSGPDLRKDQVVPDNHGVLHSTRKKSDPGLPQEKLRNDYGSKGVHFEDPFTGLSVDESLRTRPEIFLKTVLVPLTW